MTIHVPNRMRLEHTGIQISLCGDVVDFTNGTTIHSFLEETRQLEKAGVIMGIKTLKYSFKKVSKRYESYYGINVRVRYYLRVVATRPMGPNLTEERDVWIIKKDKEPTSNRNIKMEVGLEEYLHIEFQYDKEKYHLEDVVCGQIHFVLARIPLMHMDIELIRKEIVSSGGNEVIESEVVGTFEIMDGMPARDEIIPVRMYLCPYDLSPSFSNLLNLLSVRYYINLVLIDAEGHRFFKQQEIKLWRKSEESLINNVL